MQHIFNSYLELPGLNDTKLLNAGGDRLKQLLSFKINQGDIILEILRGTNNFPEDTKAQSEIVAFCKLLIYSIYNDGVKKNVINDQVLPTDSAVYLCWYSQLRELIERCPDLASHIGICEVPGGGFRGDWFIGIVRGSVSESLGRSVLNMLTDDKEEYKRFVRGVGLPVHSKFTEVDTGDPLFYGWPGTTDVFLKDIMDIYKVSYSRASIQHYELFRSILHMIGHQIGPEYYPTVPSELCDIVKRLSNQINLLSSSTSDDGKISGLGIATIP